MRTNDVQLLDGHIAYIKRGYKYLGCCNHMTPMMRRSERRQESNVRRGCTGVFRSHLNGGNEIAAINAYAIPVIRYLAMIATWPTGEVKQLDIKTLKLMTLHGRFHPKSSTCRLYVCRMEGGRGLQSVHGSIRDEEAKLKFYCQEQSTPSWELVTLERGLSGRVWRLEDQEAAWWITQADWGGGWYGNVQALAENIRFQWQHWGTDDGCTRSSSEHMINSGQHTPHHWGRQTVVRDGMAHSQRMLPASIQSYTERHN